MNHELRIKIIVHLFMILGSLFIIHCFLPQPGRPHLRQDHPEPKDFRCSLFNLGNVCANHIQYGS